MAAAPSLSPTSQPVRYTLDGSHSHVGFSVRHMMIANVRGEFQTVSADVTLDAKDPERSRILATIDVASLNTRDAKRDAHLKSADFFNAETFPQLTFVSSEVKPQDGGFAVTGDLTIANTTRQVVLTVEDVTPEHTDPWGNQRLGATARTKIRRSDFGMKWNAALEAGGVLVGDEISIQIEAELVRQK